jgi:hypothetical protein
MQMASLLWGPSTFQWGLLTWVDESADPDLADRSRPEDVLDPPNTPGTTHPDPLKPAGGQREFVNDDPIWLNLLSLPCCYFLLNGSWRTLPKLH